MLDDVPFDKIDVKDLERLKENAVPESRSIDYKRDDPTAGSREQYLANVTSFANTIGGFLLYGVEADAETSAPTAFPGLAIAATDKTELTLNSMLRDNVDPRMGPPDYRWVDVTDGRKVLIIRIRQSWAAPHAATRHGKYYQRNSNGKQPMDTHELRNAFMLAGRAEERFDVFCTRRNALLLGRVSDPSNDRRPCKLQPGAFLVVHAAPLAVLTRPYVLDIRSNVSHLRAVTPHAKLSHHDAPGRPNVDGYLVQVNPDGAQATYAYLQVFRAGTAELTSVAPRVRVMSRNNDGPLLLDSGWVERTAVADVGSLLRLFAGLNFTGPVLARLALLHCGSMRFQTGTHGHAAGSGQLDRNSLILGTAVCDEVGDIARLLRPAFDAMWNAFGFNGSENYSPDGDWQRPPET